ncbi:transcription factor SAC51-like [Telopea speciosissima]|uniref:transcription factor SAC51-like n=1 Tax=Telopea speciosissima TaxID=54955 RepID=UPI001CC58F27|nr:transcription factor SAC51-like [Telopea speciosissima]XP_043708235.1 transcription factor SAC51-like [Telopea speciosissima]XP_043708236.1 transcription factor SAC51-like [Telopea speciosissima]
MGKNCDSWIHQQHSALQSPFQNCMSPPLSLGLENTFPAYANPQTGMASANDTMPLPGFAFPELGNLKTAQPVEQQGWFYCLPRHRHAAFAPPDCIAKDKFSALPHGCFSQATAAPNAEPASVQKQFHWQAAFASSDCIAKDKFSAFPNGYFGQVAATPNAEAGSVQKRFLVFDHSGNQTSFFISSVIAPTIPFQHQSCKIPSQFDAKGIHEELAANRDPIYQSGPVIVSDGLNENHESDGGSEMREDTEELNALLYSDDEYEDTGCSEEDDEVASTGHSPSEMTGHEKQEEEEEEVASSGGPNKKRKLLDGEHEATCSVMDTANSAKPNGLLLEYEDDAESSCIRGRAQGGKMGALPLGQKRLRKERIRETVSILQNIIPGGKGKDAAMVLDEAIQYLRSLKVKAKALGTSTTILN